MHQIKLTTSQFFNYVHYWKWDYPSILKADIQAIHNWPLVCTKLLLFTYFRSRVMTPMRNPLPKMGTKKLLTIGTMKMKKEEKNCLKKNLTIITKKMFTNLQDQWFLCQKCSGWFQWFGLKNKTIVIVNHTTISTLSSFLQVTSVKILFWINHEIFFSWVGKFVALNTALKLNLKITLRTMYIFCTYEWGHFLLHEYLSTYVTMRVCLSIIIQGLSR